MIPLEELDDTTQTRKVARGQFDCIGCEPPLQWSRVYIYTPDMSRKRLQL